jgi:hypothetical protein
MRAASPMLVARRVRDAIQALAPQSRNIRGRRHRLTRTASRRCARTAMPARWTRTIQPLFGVRRAPTTAPVVAHPPRLGSAVDEEGFHVIESKRRWRRHPHRALTSPHPVPATLVGLCFICLASDHVAARYRLPSRCLVCKGTGHRARDCKRACSPDRANTPLPPRSGRTVRPRPCPASPQHVQSTDDDMISGHSCSTGRETSVPPP